MKLKGYLHQLVGAQFSLTSFSLEVTNLPPIFSTNPVAHLAMHWDFKINVLGSIPLAVSFLHHVFLPKVL
jgi:hypothetical protein